MCVHVQMHGLMHHRLQSLNNLMKVLIAVLLVRERVTERGPRAVSCCSCCAEAQDEQQKQRMRGAWLLGLLPRGTCMRGRTAWPLRIICFCFQCYPVLGESEC